MKVNKQEALHEYQNNGTEGGICEHCKNEEKTTRDRSCPYAEDAHNSIVKVFICDACATERARDV